MSLLPRPEASFTDREASFADRWVLFSSR